MAYRYFIKLAYNGTKYHGWQIQTNAITIQELITNALAKILKVDVELVGAGRTDTGVHAKMFYAHFDYELLLTKEQKHKLIFKLNLFLPTDIVIYDILQVKNDAHARFNALSRTYHYVITTRKDPFNLDLSYYFYAPLDINLMNKAAEILFDFNDFTSFSKSRTQTKTNNCKIMQAHWHSVEDKIVFTIKSNRFLRNMVRAIVGTLLDVGKRKITLLHFKQIIEAKSRSNAGYSVPASGLFLNSIEYPADIFID